jgi:hypothetical protein
MSTTSPTVAPLASDVQSVLGGLRWRIRLYVWLEGLALAAIWLGVTFWIALGLDYLPVLVGASEMPLAARAVLLLVMAGGFGYILFRYIGQRAFVPLHDRSMAMLLERRFTELNETLMTSVELSQRRAEEAEFNQEMFARTSEQAKALIPHVRYGRVFNSRRLVLLILLAIGLLGSVAAFGAVSPPSLQTAAERLFLLQDQPWPRQAHIEVVGIEVQRPATADDPAPRPLFLSFSEGKVKVAKGSNVTLRVRADLPPKAKFAPETCTVYYRSQAREGIRSESGRVAMAHYRDQGEFRNFWLEEKPFKGILSTLTFDVAGYDHRVRGFQIEVVESPAIVETKLDLVYPEYIRDDATSSYLPKLDKEYLAAGEFQPVGTQVTLKFRASKELKLAEIYNPATKERTEIPIDANAPDRTRFIYEIPSLDDNVALEILLVDLDGVSTEQPHRVFLSVIEDQPPQIDVTLKGIGSAVTPNVVIPLRGKVSDDYGIELEGESEQARQVVRLMVQTADSVDPQVLPFHLGKGNAVEQDFDFRALRSQNKAFELQPKGKLILHLRARDRFNLNGSEPHEGTGQIYTLDVVTPDELLSQLEVREIGLRRRMEQIVDEMNQLRDSLVRLKNSLAPAVPGAADLEELTDDEGKAARSPEEKKRAQIALRRSRVTQAINQSEKSNQETLGVALGFELIREELINNRVDTEDRKKRLKEQIADPLKVICATSFPALDGQLKNLDEALEKLGTADPPANLADEALEQATDTIAELDAVLQRMLDLETFNELLDIVRDLIADQEKLIDKTKTERKRQALEDLK